MTSDLANLSWDAPADEPGVEELEWDLQPAQTTAPRRAMPDARRDNLNSSVASTALEVARSERGRALLAVKEGRLTPAEVIELATTSGPRNPLLKLTLSQLLLAQFRVAPRQVKPIIEHLSSVLSEAPEKMTIAWLVDRRAHGRRFQVWLDAQRPKEVPWPGFPWKAEPDVA